MIRPPHVARLLVATLLLLSSACGTAGVIDGDDIGAGGSPSTAPETTGPTIAPTTTGPPAVASSNTHPSTTSTSTTTSSTTTEPLRSAVVRTGADVAADDNFALFAGERVALIANQTSTTGGVHLIDALDRAAGVELVAVFAPEHGVRGSADAGAHVGDTVDESTGVPIYSLFGSTREPTPTMLAGVDTVVFDLQDVGTRFYTYISTMGLAMRAAERSGARFVVFDRPNPIGGDVSGFLRAADQESFVGQFPIPAVYGLTAGELALAIAGEGWLGDLSDLELDVVEVEGWTSDQRWTETGLPWVAPSPGLPTFEAALVYPGTVLFEATTVSYGKGTDAPFTTIGAPWIDGDALAELMNGLQLPGVRFDPVTFTPRLLPEMTYAPAWQDTAISGVRYRITDEQRFKPLETGLWLLDAINRQSRDAGQGSIVDRAPMFDLLAGTSSLRKRLAAGEDPAKIIADWQADVSEFETQRAPYLRYVE